MRGLRAVKNIVRAFIIQMCMLAPSSIIITSWLFYVFISSFLHLKPIFILQNKIFSACFLDEWMAFAGSLVSLCESAPATRPCRAGAQGFFFCYSSEKMNNKNEVRDAAAGCVSWFRLILIYALDTFWVICNMHLLSWIIFITYSFFSYKME